MRRLAVWSVLWLAIFSTACRRGSGAGSALESVAPVSSCAYTPPSIAACPSGLTCNLNVTYAMVGTTALTMDVARPATGGPYPLIVLIHGGGFTAGDKSDRRLDAAALALHGYVAASIDYRLMNLSDGTDRFPAAVEDVRCAVRSLRAAASTWNVDPTKVGAMGTSAGGVLTGILGTESDVGGLDGGWCPAAAQPVTLTAVAPIYGAFDLHPGAPGSPNADAGTAVWLHQPPDDPAIDTLASSIDHIDPSDPPFLLVHGDADTTIPIAQSQDMVAALQAGGVRATLVTVPGAPHAFDPFDGAAGHEEAACTLFAFFDRWL